MNSQAKFKPEYQEWILQGSINRMNVFETVPTQMLM